ncbi:MAG: hypothetical protein Q8L81_19005 [Bacteroidota bacterium]|nr:hypothetical protein [Bacteroidota bacterium]
MKKTILILLIFLVNVSFSQRRYVPGYLYTGNNDSIAGKIKDKLFFSSPGKKIKFIGADGVKKKYKAKNLYGYAMLGLLKYLSVPASPFGGRLRFMQVIEDGDLILLSYTQTTSSGGSYGSSYGRVGGGMYRTGGTTTTTRYFIVKKGSRDKTGRIPLIGFKNFMLSYVSDDAEVKKLVEEKSLTFMDAQLIIKKYNDNKRKNKT